MVRTILFADLVESCCLAETDEAGTASRWRGLRMAIEHSIVPRHGGRLIRTEGDGLMIVFEQVLAAARCALEIQRACQSTASDSASGVGSGGDALLLRMSLHETELLADERDVYGHGVNLAARLYSLAGPGEIVVSERIFAQLGAGFEDAVEDLGQCHLKHLTKPVRAYRLGGAGPRPLIPPHTAFAPPLWSSIAVIPFAARAIEPTHYVLGELIADEIIAALSRSSHLRVISRLSTTALREQHLTGQEVGALLNARYVVSGGYNTRNGKVVLSLELADARLDRVVWAQTLYDSIDSIVAGKSEMVDKIIQTIGFMIVANELEHARSHALPTLESSTLLLAAIALMHRGVRDEFERAGQMLEVLAERGRRQAVPNAWLAKWHVLRFNRGWTSDRLGEAQYALDCAKRALDADSESSMALAVEGFVQTNLLKRLDEGEELYEHALQVNPNDSLAWLLKGTLHAFKGEGQQAVDSTENALALSPLDPLRNFYESLSATAALSAGQYERAIELAQRALRVGRNNTSTLRALAIAQSELGMMDAARTTVRKVLAIEPGLTMRNYLERSPSAAYATGRIWSEALGRAGLPAQ
ncbi:adenylate/guanylate cyclase domain-containing protein [Paraburkholderia sp. FT54]|uniref:adenylate/guanylate cyclase domain-containing protein n=1 Tax=Paraburkholderia sp. FT54 TaxID=3074437 RepID=UPI002877732A|nr:tetratricopeptide repeat protein [Paraburkholderia sp. FT54]WNC90828.1 adenylate/guanylate cyclase domain-containing protein [Paraburkholderia sp. FT54]